MQRLHSASSARQQRPDMQFPAVSFCFVSFCQRAAHLRAACKMHSVIFGGARWSNHWSSRKLLQQLHSPVWEFAPLYIAGRRVLVVLLSAPCEPHQSFFIKK
jgi:hypothetical protein